MEHYIIKCTINCGANPPIKFGISDYATQERITPDSIENVYKTIASEVAKRENIVVNSSNITIDFIVNYKNL